MKPLASANRPGVQKSLYENENENVSAIVIEVVEAYAIVNAEEPN